MGMHRKWSEICVQILYSQRGARNKKGPTISIWEQCVPLTGRNSGQNSPKCPIMEQTVPCADRNSVQNSPK